MSSSGSAVADAGHLVESRFIGKRGGGTDGLFGAGDLVNGADI